MTRALIAGSLIVCLHCTTAYAEVTNEQAVKCLVGEASGEGFIGMQAVGEVLRRRNSTRRFYGCESKRKEPAWVYEVARKAWEASADSNVTNDATHFEGKAFKKPYWADEMKVVAVIKNQVFYREVV